MLRFICEPPRRNSPSNAPRHRVVDIFLCLSGPPEPLGGLDDGLHLQGESQARHCQDCPGCWVSYAFGLAIAHKLEAITSRLEAMAISLQAITSGLEAITSRVEAITSGWRPSLLG